MQGQVNTNAHLVWFDEHLTLHPMLVGSIIHEHGVFVICLFAMRFFQSLEQDERLIISMLFLYQ